MKYSFIIKSTLYSANTSTISNEYNTNDILENVIDTGSHPIRRVNDSSWIVKLRIKAGSIVKVQTAHLFDEETAKGTHATNIYGVPHTIMSDDVNHGRTWAEDWVLSQF